MCPDDQINQCGKRFDRIEEKLDSISQHVHNHLPHKIEQFTWRIVFFVLSSMAVTIGTMIAMLKWVV